MFLLRLAEVHVPSAGVLLIYTTTPPPWAFSGVKFYTFYLSKQATPQGLMSHQQTPTSSFLCLGLIFLSRGVDCNIIDLIPLVRRLYSVNKMHRSSVVDHGLMVFCSPALLRLIWGLFHVPLAVLGPLGISNDGGLRRGKKTSDPKVCCSADCLLGAHFGHHDLFW